MHPPTPRYPWFTTGDLNAFFGLALDNVTNLVILTGILAGVFGFPTEFIFTHLIPGTAFGVMVGDLLYTKMAFGLARRTGRTDVTAMPLGLDTPSTIGIAFAVLGPVYQAALRDTGTEQAAAMIAWQVGMATMIYMGLCKLALSFAGEWVRRLVPQAGLLGSLAGVGIALLGFLPLCEMFELPIVGIVSFGLVLVTLVAKLPLPGRIPGMLASVLVGTALYYGLGEAGFLAAYHRPDVVWRFTLPIPTLGFAEGLSRAVDYLPVAIPFGLLTVIGGINTTESARVAGDAYKTRDILLVEAVATLMAGVTGGVAQSTPYIGHPAYKSMGGRAGYTLATGLFIGLGGIFGYASFFVDALPKAAVVPILIFVGLEIVSQTYRTCPPAHFPAVFLALLPSVANLVQIRSGQILGALRAGAAALPADLAAVHQVTVALGNGFILTAMLWGAFGAFLFDRKLKTAALTLGLCAAFSFFGIIHSVLANGALYLPWTTGSPLPLHLTVGYAGLAVLLLLLSLRKSAPVHPGVPSGELQGRQSPQQSLAEGA